MPDVREAWLKYLEGGLVSSRGIQHSLIDGDFE